MRALLGAEDRADTSEDRAPGLRSSSEAPAGSPPTGKDFSAVAKPRALCITEHTDQNVRIHSKNCARYQLTRRLIFTWFINAFATYMKTLGFAGE